ncbi:hypothetical protein KKH23_04380 [Patescibacteria group bacterium]|nr:hypothetical protein [Patescibacteria group bacterium]
MGLVSDLRLLVERPSRVPGTTTALWNSGVATSGQPGADLFTYGVADQWWRLQEAYLWLFPGVWNVASVITVRSYIYLMGSEVPIGDEDWDADGTDGNVAYIYWFWLMAEIYGPLRVEVYSNNGADDGVIAPYEYRVKSW